MYLCNFVYIVTLANLNRNRIMYLPFAEWQLPARKSSTPSLRAGTMKCVWKRQASNILRDNVLLSVL